MKTSKPSRAGIAALVAVWALAAMLARCGNVRIEPPGDATDSDPGDPADTAIDTGNDTAIDTGNDTGIDSAADTIGDPLPDAPLDADDTTDLPVDPVADDPVADETLDAWEVAWDVPDDWSPETPDGWPYPTHPQCSANGGSCSGSETTPCPAGYQPYRYNPTAHCDSGGWCCVPAGYSPCSDTGTSNCLWAASCASFTGGCWASEPTGLECPASQVCCIDTCV